ncbi:MAG: hypothetical protein R6U78_00755, partial [Bacteroidales bacterium]
ERTQIERTLVKLDSGRDKLISAVEKGLLSDEEVSTRINHIRDQEEEARGRLQVIEDTLSRLPDPDKLKDLSRFKGKLSYIASKHDPEWILKKDFEFQRSLLEKAFAGKDQEGNRNGVYVDYKDGNWEIELRGVIGMELLRLPLDRETMMDMFKLDPQFIDVDKEISRIEQNITSYIKY